MHVKYMPRRMDKGISYTINGESITAEVAGQVDTWDFSAMPDGEAAEITSTLDPCPVLAARRTEGVLHVTLLRAVPARPKPTDYEHPEEYEQALDAWRRLWTDDLEVVIGG